MTPETLTGRLAAMRHEAGGLSPDCPDEHVVAAYADGTLSEALARPFEHHLADCGHCLGLVALLSSAREAEAGAAPGGALASSPARATTARRQRWRTIQKWAAAAALVLAVPVLYQLGGDAGRGLEGQEGPPTATTRMAAPAAGGLQVLSPGPGVTIDPSQLVFSWTEVTGSPYYDLRVVTDEGDIVVEQRVATTSWQPPPSLRLRPGAEYFVVVEAYPAGDQPLNSHHVPFRVPD